MLTDRVLKRCRLPLLGLMLSMPALAAAQTGHATAPVMSADEICRRIADKLASVRFSECRNQKLEPSGGQSVNGIPILVKTYPPVEQRKPLGKVLLVGGMHGDEYSSISIVFKWMNILNQHHSGMFYWRIVPLINPDGLLRDTSQRLNANGVDLSRNFPLPDGSAESGDYRVSTAQRNAHRNFGEDPLSEPESRWLAREIERFDPDVIVALHAPYRLADYDVPYHGHHRLGRLYLERLATYPGSLGRYAGVQLNIPLVTIELPYAGTMPSPEEINTIWSDLVGWLEHNMPDDGTTTVAADQHEPASAGNE